MNKGETSGAPSTAGADADRTAPVSNLPFAQGRSFHTLDEYLAFLEERGAMDIPWYREIRPGIYELVARGPRREPQTFTREQLEKRFGFSR